MWSDGDDRLNSQQTTASHVAVSAPRGLAIWEFSFFAWEKSPNEGRVDNRIAFTGDERVECFEVFVYYEWNVYSFDD